MPSGHLPVTRNVNSFDVLVNYDDVVNFGTDIHAERRQILQWHRLESQQRHQGGRTGLYGGGN